MRHAVHPATLDDVSGIQALVNAMAFSAEGGDLLPRSRESIEGNLGYFSVIRDEGRVIGCVALARIGNDLAEIRSLAMHADYRGLGLGAALVDHTLEQAKDRGYERVFALTRRPGFFEKLGFKVGLLSQFPQKVWLDCQPCPRRAMCDETAVVIAV
ncbi:MAG: GNAT family N-acetyltransferase [Dehalococcoidia bacterium]